MNNIEIICVYKDREKENTTCVFTTNLHLLSTIYYVMAPVIMGYTTPLKSIHTYQSSNTYKTLLYFFLFIFSHLN